VWTHSANDLFVLAIRRARQLVGRGDLGWDYSLTAVLSSPKNMNSKLEIERWERQWRVCRLNGLADVESEFDPFGRSILELGCGPVLGFGPIAIFRGAERFWYLEPDFSRAVLESLEVKNKYFEPLFHELTANYGRLQSFDEWYSRIIELSQPFSEGMAGEVDITLSHSVLEHIPLRELPILLDALYAASRPDGRFFHTVDFGPHGGAFNSLYSQDQTVERQNLNLLRRSEVEAAMSSAGFTHDASIVYKTDDVPKSDVHRSWQKYSRTDLESRVVFMIGRRGATFETAPEIADKI